MMHSKYSSWKEYFVGCLKDKAFGKNINSIEYGKNVYTSPFVEIQLSNKDRNIVQAKWSVFEFHDEYNVFFNICYPKNMVRKEMIANFKWKERAIQFAIETYLICLGKLNRKGVILD